jgi:hypothetical protein
MLIYVSESKHLSILIEAHQALLQIKSMTELVKLFMADICTRK